MRIVRHSLAQEFPASQPDQYINWVAFGGEDLLLRVCGCKLWWPTAYLPTLSCPGDKDSGFFRAKLVADYSIAQNREDKLNVEVLAPLAHGCNCMIKRQRSVELPRMHHVQGGRRRMQMSSAWMFLCLAVHRHHLHAGTAQVYSEVPRRQRGLVAPHLR